jgi:hypothetical protein
MTTMAMTTITKTITMSTMTRKTQATQTGLPNKAARIQKETRSRRSLFVVTIAAFAGMLGIIVATEPAIESPASASPNRSELVGDTIMEYLVPPARPGDPPTLVRIIQEPESTARPTTRTRAS